MSLAPSKYPETYSQLLVRSFRLYCQVLKPTFFFALLVSIVLFIPRLLADAAGQTDFLYTMNMGSQLVLCGAMYISVLWFLAATLWCINCIERKKHKNFIDDLEMAGKRIIYVLGAAILLLCISMLAGCIVYLLNLILWELNLYSYNKYVSSILLFMVLVTQLGISIGLSILFYFYFPLIVIEGDGIILGLKTSAQLVWSRMWRTLWLQLTPWLIYIATLVAIKMLFNIQLNIFFMPIDTASNFYSSALNILILALFIPWGSSMTLVQLRDLELRKKAISKKK